MIFSNLGHVFDRSPCYDEFTIQQRLGDELRVEKDLIAYLDSKFESVIGQIVEVKVDVSDLKQDVQVLQADVSELKQDVQVLQTDVSELKLNVGVLQTDVSGLKQDVGGLKNQVRDVNINFVHLQTQTNSMEHRVITLDKTIRIVDQNMSMAISALRIDLQLLQS